MTTIKKDMTGIYIHIPFCFKKCPYCDFYSFSADEEMKDSYLKAVLFCLKKWKKEISDCIDTVYFGGGTPNIFGSERINQVLAFIKKEYCLTEDCEITVECNPSSLNEDFITSVARRGVNRISMGMQSAVDRERHSLGRSSTASDIEKTIAYIKKAGIDNISLDIMLGVPHQDMESLDESIDFLLRQDIKHISAYMLKIEEGTDFDKRKGSLPVADEDTLCDMYLHTVRRLEDGGFSQYEISNFSLPGYESRHNMRYWLGKEYLGIGPSAHSFIKGKRFYYSRDFDAFISSPTEIDDGDGGGEEEFIMLRLRLTKGLIFNEYEERFQKSLPAGLIKKAQALCDADLVSLNEEKIALTKKGFLLSNTIISQLLS